jgi:single-stranded-DNA-specific exonuclease
MDSQTAPARERRWIMPPPVTEADARQLAGTLDLPVPFVRLLLARGHHAPDDLRAFLSPRLENLSPCDGLPGLDEGVERLLRAVEHGEGIMVHGDYDVDGLSATAFLYRFLRRVTPKVSCYIPNRLVEGYGLSEASIAECRNREAGLLVTVDCGARAHREVELARAVGIDCIITDHHHVDPTLPTAAAVVNPQRPGGDPRHRDLAGVGVAFRFVQKLAEVVGRDETEWRQDLDLVALGTIADIVRLRGDNRILAAEGLRQMAATRKPGMRALMDVCNVTPEGLAAWHVGFMIGPRLNAAGRLGIAERSLRLLLTSDPREAGRLAGELDRENRSRQRLDREILREVVERVEQELDLESTWAIVLSSTGWHRGVVGIVASRVVERFGRPTMLIALDGEEGRGSGRSVRGFDLAGALTQMEDLLIAHGGHAMAAGLSIAPENIPDLRDRLNELAASALTPADLARRFRLDGDATLQEVDLTLVRSLARLEPHGMGNPKPLFAVRGVSLAETPRVMKGEHLRFRVRQGDVSMRAVAFGMAKRLPELEENGGNFDLAFEASEDTWQGNGAVELTVRDFLPAGDPRGRAEA